MKRTTEYGSLVRSFFRVNSPEKWLLWNIVLRALWDLTPGKSDKQNGVFNKIKRDAQAWIYNPSSEDEIGSFAWCASYISDTPESFINTVRRTASSKLFVGQSVYHSRFRQ